MSITPFLFILYWSFSLEFFPYRFSLSGGGTIEPIFSSSHVTHLSRSSHSSMLGPMSYPHPCQLASSARGPAATPSPWLLPPPYPVSPHCRTAALLPVLPHRPLLHRSCLHDPPWANPTMCTC